MYSDTLVVSGINAAPAAMIQSGQTTPPAQIQITATSPTTGLSIVFRDLASNASTYVFGESLALTIAPVAAKTS